MYDRVKFIDEFILYVLYELDSIMFFFYLEVYVWIYVIVFVNFILYELVLGFFNRWKELVYLKYIKRKNSKFEI